MATVNLTGGKEGIKKCIENDTISFCKNIVHADKINKLNISSLVCHTLSTLQGIFFDRWYSLDLIRPSLLLPNVVIFEVSPKSST